MGAGSFFVWEKTIPGSTNKTVQKVRQERGKGDKACVKLLQQISAVGNEAQFSRGSSEKLCGISNYVRTKVGAFIHANT